MRRRATALRGIGRIRSTAAYHASRGIRCSGQATTPPNEIVFLEALAERNVIANEVRPSLSRIRRYLRHYLPFDDFSSSLYSVPILLVFRLFYPAAPYSIKHALQGTKCGIIPCAIQDVLQAEGKVESKAFSLFLCTYAKLDVNTFSKAVSRYPNVADAYRIVTLTWVKALASPLSHEFLQIVVEHTESGQRHRLVTERTDIGDTVTVGWDWSSHEYASHHHILPLPLLSLSFHEGTGPSLSQLGIILTDISKVQSYNLLREMCWWYAEKTFKHIAKHCAHTNIKHWPHASLRYSFVIQNNWIRRQKLVREAEKFRTLTRNQMLF